MSLTLTYDGISDFNSKVEQVGYWARIRAFFTIEGLNKWFARIASQDVKKIHIQLREVYELMLKDQANFQSLTEKEFIKFQELVLSLTHLKRIYARGNFFDNKEFEKLMEETLQIAYSVEAELRIHAFKSKKTTFSDQDLKEAISQKSKESLAGKL